MKNIFFTYPSVFFALLTALILGVPLQGGSQTPSSVGGKRAPTPHEAKVFAALDLSRSELAAVAMAVDAKDYAKATQELGTYIRQRQNIHWGRADGGPQRFSIEVANDGVIGRIQPPAVLDCV